MNRLIKYNIMPGVLMLAVCAFCSLDGIIHEKARESLYVCLITILAILGIMMLLGALTFDNRKNIKEQEESQESEKQEPKAES